MGTGNELLMVCDTPRPSVRVARFVRPDLRDHLDSSGAVDQSTLFQQLHTSALQNLGAGDTVILNFGLIDWFPSGFFRLLLAVNAATTVANAKLLLCCLPPLAKEAFGLMRGDLTFAGRVFESEAGAISAATHPA